MAALNNMPAVQFDGDDYLWADRYTEFGTLNGSKTVFFVVRVRSGDGGYVFDNLQSLDLDPEISPAR